MPPEIQSNETIYDKNLYTVNMFRQPVKKELLSASNISRMIGIISNIDTNKDKSKQILMENIHYLLYTDENNNTLLHKLANISNEYPSDEDFKNISAKLGGIFSVSYLTDVFDKVLSLIIDDVDVKNEISKMKLSKRINSDGYNPYVVAALNDNAHDSKDARANKVKAFFDEVERMERASYGGKSRTKKRRTTSIKRKNTLKSKRRKIRKSRKNNRKTKRRHT